MRLLRETGEAVLLAGRMLVGRPWLVLLFVAAQLVSNLLRLWIGSVDGGSVFLYAVGGVFLFARIFLTQWLHVAAARLADDRGVTALDAFRVAPRQALWFHLMVLVSIVTFGVRRLWLDQIAGGFFAPVGIGGASTIAAIIFGLVVTYILFLVFTPGYFAALLGPWNPTLRWSFAGICGQLAFSVATIMLLATPLAIVRRYAFDLIGEGGAGLVFVTAALDAALTVLLMLVTTAVYWRAYVRALERIGPPPDRLGEGAPIRVRD